MSECEECDCADVVVLCGWYRCLNGQMDNGLLRRSWTLLRKETSKFKTKQNKSHGGEKNMNHKKSTQKTHILPTFERALGESDTYNMIILHLCQNIIY